LVAKLASQGFRLADGGAISVDTIRFKAPEAAPMATETTKSREKAVYEAMAEYKKRNRELEQVDSQLAASEKKVEILRQKRDEALAAQAAAGEAANKAMAATIAGTKAATAAAFRADDEQAPVVEPKVAEAAKVLGEAFKCTLGTHVEELLRQAAGVPAPGTLNELDEPAEMDCDGIHDETFENLSVQAFQSAVWQAEQVLRKGMAEKVKSSRSSPSADGNRKKAAKVVELTDEQKKLQEQLDCLKREGDAIVANRGQTGNPLLG
jgi:hypothetical protein